jgi:hypothetical protein
MGAAEALRLELRLDGSAESRRLKGTGRIFPIPTEVLSKLSCGNRLVSSDIT